MQSIEVLFAIKRLYAFASFIPVERFHLSPPDINGNYVVSMKKSNLPDSYNSVGPIAVSGDSVIDMFNLDSLQNAASSMTMYTGGLNNSSITKEQLEESFEILKKNDPKLLEETV